MSKIKQVNAREIIDSRGNPTVEVDVTLESEIMGRASVPSGASTGTNEALELRDDNPKRYDGKGVTQAVQNVNEKIAPELIGLNVLEQAGIDETMIALDGTVNKSRLGANAILGVSLACAHAGARFNSMPLFRYLGGAAAKRMPIPMMNIINGGAHSDAPIDFQEFMIRPIGADSFHEALRMGIETFHSLKSLLKKRGLSTAVGDEGGFAPELPSIEDALDMIVQAIVKAGYKPSIRGAKGDISIALDCAASEFFNTQTKKYEYKKAGQRLVLSAEKQVEYLAELVRNYPIDSIEDGMSENDWNGWQYMHECLGDKIQLVGDDLIVTNVEYLRKAIELNAANAVLIKLNQIGTLTETLNCIEMARNACWESIVSHRSGETEDTTIADLAVASGVGQIKTGSGSRTDRICKYNQLLRIEEELAGFAEYGYKE